jgi:hypothetical protein
MEVKCRACNDKGYFMDGGISLYCACQEGRDLMNKQVSVSNDPVNHPKHYTSHPSGVECITITQHMGFCLGNAVKYIWRADLKNDAVEDLKKAKWYIEKEIERRTICR